MQAGGSSKTIIDETQATTTTTATETSFTGVNRNLSEHCFCIGNIYSSTTTEEILILFGFGTTPETRRSSSAEIFLNNKGRCKCYATFALEIPKPNGDNRKLVTNQQEIHFRTTQDDKRRSKSTLPYNARHLQLTRWVQSNCLPSRVSCKNNTEISPTATNSTREGEIGEEGETGHGKITRVRGSTPEIKGRQTNKPMSYQIMAEQLWQKHMEIERWAMKKRQLHFEIYCNRVSVTERAVPNAAAIYRALTEKFCLPMSPSRTM